MPDPTAIRLASDARRADLADDLYNLSVDARDRVDKAYQDERAALLVALDLLAKAKADRDASAEHVLLGAAVGHRAEERKAWQDATGCPTPDEARAKRERWTEVSRANLATIDDLRAQLAEAEAEADNLRRRVDIAEASRADQVRMHDRAQAALEEERARVAELEARPVLTVEALTALVEAMDDAVPAHAYLLIDAGTGTARLSFSMDGRFTKAEPLYRKHEVRRWVASIAADSTVTLPTPDRGEAGRASIAALIADGVDAIRDSMPPSPRYVAVAASAVPPGTAPERVAWFGSISHASTTAKQLNSGDYKRSVMEWGGDPGPVAILDTHAEPPPVADDLNRRAMEDSPAAKARRLREDMIATTKQMNAVASTTPAEAPPVAPPRFVAVPRGEINGRPANVRVHRTAADAYAASCNDNPYRFHADVMDDFDTAIYPHAVVDTRPEGP